jgi:hypothetical protein
VIKGVVQTCDGCGKEEVSPGMRVPDGWLMIDTTGGHPPGERGYGWNLCGIECLLNMLDAWSAGENPMPWGMSEQHQIIHNHGHDGPGHSHDDIEAVARESAQMQRRAG